MGNQAEFYTIWPWEGLHCPHVQIDIYTRGYLEKMNVQVPLSLHSPSTFFFLIKKAANKIRNVTVFFYLAGILASIPGCQGRKDTMTLFSSITFHKKSTTLPLVEVEFMHNPFIKLKQIVYSHIFFRSLVRDLVFHSFTNHQNKKKINVNGHMVP